MIVVEPLLGHFINKTYSGGEGHEHLEKMITNQ